MGFKKFLKPKGRGKKVEKKTDKSKEESARDIRKEQGEEGERLLGKWLDDAKLGHVHITQDTKTFATMFNGAVKRPDFFVLIDSIGLIAVDAKNCAKKSDGYTLEYEEELKRVLAFERLFRIPVWYAYLNREDKKQWHWISALKAIEVGKLDTSAAGKEYLKIPLEHFCKIEGNQDLGKLYLQRHGTYGEISDVEGKLT